jgi:hypothetical protein
MGNNLVIGNTSQLSKYFPDDYRKISSRNINDNDLHGKWDSVYITFAKQNVFDKNDSNFNIVNTYYTLNLVEKLLDTSDKIVVYTSCEIFNNNYGKVGLDSLPSFIPKKNQNYTNYILSKFLLNQHIKENRKKNKKWDKVVVIHPFNFDSVHKSKYFLFGKVTDSIINKRKIEVADLNFYRDVIHTSRMVEESINSHCDRVIGSGKIINLRSSIKQIYSHFDMDFNEYVSEKYKTNEKVNFYYADNELEYNFVDDMILDLKKCMISEIFK